MITPRSIVVSSSSSRLTDFQIETLSTSSVWAGAGTVTNSGSTLRWSVSGGVIIPTVINDNPVIDLSGNGGTAIVTVRNADSFSGITSLNLASSDVTSIDISELTNLEILNLGDNSELSTLDLSNSDLDSLDLSHCDFSSIDISQNNNLTTLIMAFCSLTTLDISNNNALENIDVSGNSLSSTEIDDIMRVLDDFGLTNGSLNYELQFPLADPTSNSREAYSNLVGKGWVITGAAPP